MKVFATIVFDEDSEVEKVSFVSAAGKVQTRFTFGNIQNLSKYYSAIQAYLDMSDSTPGELGVPDIKVSYVPADKCIIFTGNPKDAIEFLYHEVNLKSFAPAVESLKQKMNNKNEIGIQQAIEESQNSKCQKSSYKEKYKETTPLLAFNKGSSKVLVK